jgi:pimeloyl-ACP methyl ester carboxylesterase
MVLEHRYYGDSQPFTAEQGGWSSDNLKWLDSNNALADIAQFIDFINDDLKSKDFSKRVWIVCGGSYPGALSAWFRSLYPDHALISWSSSGVINAIQDFSVFDLDIY